MKFIQNQAVENLIDEYPDTVSAKLNYLRQLIIETARELNDIKTLEETFKWGEASYISNIGSTIRIDWKKKNPEHYAMYFICSTQMIETFREFFGDVFKYEGDRAIIFHIDDVIPVDQLKLAIAVALTYKKRSKLSMLGL
jgi:hypothetical protein